MIDIEDGRTYTLLTALGTPYSWGAGDLKNGLIHYPTGVAGLGGGIGYDCSGFAQAALLALGIVDPDAWHDLSAHDMANACDAVKMGDEQVGDLCFYGGRHLSHVTVVLAPGLCIGANGGGSKTNADNPNACVQVRSIAYRSDFVTIGRLNAEHRQ